MFQVSTFKLILILYKNKKLKYSKFLTQLCQFPVKKKLQIVKRSRLGEPMNVIWSELVELHENTWRSISFLGLC